MLLFNITAAKWNPVLESHQPLRCCRPPPELLGQRDVWNSMNKPQCAAVPNVQVHRQEGLTETRFDTEPTFV